MEMGFWHGLYGLDLYEMYNFYGCQKQFEYFEFNFTDIDIFCLDVYETFNALTEKINPYDIYGKCYETTESP